MADSTLYDYSHRYELSAYEILNVSPQDFLDIQNAVDNKHPLPEFYAAIPGTDNMYYTVDPTVKEFADLLKANQIFVYDNESVVDGGEMVMGIGPHWKTSAAQDFLDGRFNFKGDYVAVAIEDYTALKTLFDATHLPPIWYTYDEHENIILIEETDPTFQEKLSNREIYVFDSNAAEDYTSGGPGGHFEISFGDGSVEDYKNGYITRRDA